MKTLYVIFMALLLPAIKCFDITIPEENRSNTRAHYVRFEGDKFKYEYNFIFFTEGSDTLNFTCLLQRRKPYNGKNPDYKPITLRVRYDYLFPDFKNPTYAEKCDASDFGERKTDHSRHRIINVKRQIELLGQAIRSLKSYDDSIKFVSISFDMRYAGDATLEISKEYFRQNHELSVDTFHILPNVPCTDMDNIIRKSKFIRDVSSVLHNNGIQINDAIVDEAIYYPVGINEFMECNLLEDTTNLPDSVLEFYTYIYLDLKNQ